MAIRPTTRGTGFINPQEYERANAGAAKQMQDRLAAYLEQGRTNFQSSLSQRQNKFGNEMSAGTATYDENGLTADEAERRADPSNTRYRGPSSLGDADDWAGILAQGSRAERNAALGADYNGRQALIQEVYGRGTGYNAGNSRFDSFIAGSNGGQERFGALLAANNGLSRQAMAADATSRQQAEQARAASNRIREQYAAAVPILRAKESSPPPVQEPAPVAPPPVSRGDGNRRAAPEDEKLRGRPAPKYTPKR